MENNNINVFVQDWKVNKSVLEAWGVDTSLLHKDITIKNADGSEFRGTVRGVDARSRKRPFIVETSDRRIMSVSLGMFKKAIVR